VKFSGAGHLIYYRAFAARSAGLYGIALLYCIAFGSYTKSSYGFLRATAAVWQYESLAHKNNHFLTSTQNPIGAAAPVNVLQNNSISFFCSH